MYACSLVLVSLLLAYFVGLPWLSCVYRNAGSNNLENSNLPEAEANFLKATQLAPDNWDAHYGLGRSYEKMGVLNSDQEKSWQADMFQAYQTAWNGGNKKAAVALSRLKLAADPQGAAKLLNDSFCKPLPDDFIDQTPPPQCLRNHPAALPARFTPDRPIETKTVYEFALFKEQFEQLLTMLKQIEKLNLIEDRYSEFSRLIKVGADLTNYRQYIDGQGGRSLLILLGTRRFLKVI